MPQLIILCLQIIFFSLAWALFTFQLTPFLDFWRLISGSVTSSTIPEWTVHTNYFFALIFLTTGITITLRLKVLKSMLSLSLTFCFVAWILMGLRPDQYLAYLLKYVYIFGIPLIFYRVITQQSKNIDFFMKSILQILIIYAPYGIGYFSIHDSNMPEIICILWTSLLTFISVCATIGLYSKNYLRISLQIALYMFIIEFFTDLYAIYISDLSFHYNQIPFILLGLSPILFTIWVQNTWVVKKDS